MSTRVEQSAGLAGVALERFESRKSELARRFREATPFPHIALEDLLHLDPERSREFPDRNWPHWRKLGDEYQRDKSTCSEITLIPNPFRDLIHELHSPPFLRFLEAVTGIEKLLPDPYLEGGGLHMSGPGGHLAPHTDFHLYPALDLHRRLNVLIYLNPDWNEAMGGALMLHDAATMHEHLRVVPRWGTCVVFETNDESVHGVQPVAAGHVRRSLALYYYTSAETTRFSGDHSTHWRSHGEGGAIHRARVAIYRGLMSVSRAFSMLAHLVNPHFGIRMLGERLAELRRKRK